MTLQASTVWEIRTTGNNNNGGGYTSGGTDYSQQDAAQQTWTNLSSVTTTLTDDDAGGNFTAAMIGNIINLPGYGRFEITAFTDGNNVTLDAAPGLAGGDSGYVGGAVADLEQIDNVIVAGNKVWMKAGTYTLSGAISTTSGITSNAIIIEGYNSSRGDEPTGTNRPLFVCGANAFTLGSVNHFKHFRATTTHASGINLGAYCVAVNCKSENTASGNAFRIGTAATLIDCEATSDSGIAIYAAAYGTLVLGCYVHDSPTGWQTLNYASTILFTIFDTCSNYGVHFNGSSAQYGNSVVNCVIYNCGTGIYTASGGCRNRMENNAISDCTTGISFAGSPNSGAHLDYNNYYNNTGDVSGVSKGPNATAVDPKFTNAAAGDFSLQVDSALIGAGFAIRLGVG